MGILFVLAFYLVALSVLAVICSLSLMFVASRYLKRKHLQDKAAIRRAGLFPFACVAYAGVWFIVYSTINGFVFHRDPMVGDEWTTPIGDGYSITMIDITDQAILYPTDTDINSSSAIQSVRSLQIVGSEIIGVRDVDSHDRFGAATKAGNGFFAVDTKSHSIHESSSQKLLFDYASQKGVELKLLPISKVYNQHRFGWFDWLSWTVLIGVPAAVFILLVRWFVKLVATGFIAPANADSLRE